MVTGFAAAPNWLSLLIETMPWEMVIVPVSEALLSCVSTRVPAPVLVKPVVPVKAPPRVSPCVRFDAVAVATLKVAPLLSVMALLKLRP